MTAEGNLSSGSW